MCNSRTIGLRGRPNTVFNDPTSVRRMLAYLTTALLLGSKSMYPSQAGSSWLSLIVAMDRSPSVLSPARTMVITPPLGFLDEGTASLGSFFARNPKVWPWTPRSSLRASSHSTAMKPWCGSSVPKNRLALAGPIGTERYASAPPYGCVGEI